METRTITISYTLLNHQLNLVRCKWNLFFREANVKICHLAWYITYVSIHWFSFSIHRHFFTHVYINLFFLLEQNNATKKLQRMGITNPFDGWITSLFTKLSLNKHLSICFDKYAVHLAELLQFFVSF